MKTAMLSAKHCNFSAIYYKKIYPTNVDEKPYFSNGVPFYIGFIRADNNYEFHVPSIRTIETSQTIHTFRNLDFRTGDKVRIDNKDYHIESQSVSFYNSSYYNSVKNYFLVIK